MMRFIWRNWWRRKERFLLLLVGALIVSSGLTYLVGLSEMNREKVEEELQERWETSYDLVVRPEGSRSITEEQHVLEPNYLSGIHGGISIDHYEKIKQMDHVEVAAPIAMIGYLLYQIDVTNIEIEEEGYYRWQTDIVEYDGIQEHKELGPPLYYRNENHQVATLFPGEESQEWIDTEHSIGITSLIRLLLAGVDPEQEAKLVGLDQATLNEDGSRYFSDHERIEWVGGRLIFPVIINSESYHDRDAYYTIEQLTLPHSMDVVNEKVIEEGSAYLDQLEAHETTTFSVSNKELYQFWLDNISDQVDDKSVYFKEDFPIVSDMPRSWPPVMESYPSALQYDVGESPDEKKWPFAYDIIPHEEKNYTLSGQSLWTHRPFKVIPHEEGIKFGPYHIGTYDPSQLDMEQDPLSEVPMETYKPPKAQLVVDTDGTILDTPVMVQTMGEPTRFLTHPPNILTTIDAAEEIMDGDPISAIRIKVSGVSELSEGSQRLIEKVAKQIEDETGLMTDITLGSSPQRALTFVPGLNGEEDIGWVEQSWVDIGAAISMFRESNLGLVGLISSVMIVAIVYVFSSTHVSMLARKHDFATLLAIGWRPSQLSRLLLMECTLIGIFVALIAWTILGLIDMFGTVPISPVRTILTGLFGFTIYVLGATIPALIVRNIRPYEAMRTGELRRKKNHLIPTRGIISMAWTHFTGKWQRNLLSMMAIALPTSLLALFLFITMRLQGTMETTLLGHHLIVEVGPVHYIAVITALLIAILTTGEIMWQNIVERQREMAILKAVGWRHGKIGILILMEGIWMGVSAAVIGLLCGIAMIRVIYREIPLNDFLVIGAVGIIPILIAVIGSILPARMAMHMSPMSGISGGYFKEKV